MSISAMKQALKFCEDIGDLSGPYPYVNETSIVADSRKVLTALRQAIAEAMKQEPVGWWDGKESVVFAHDSIDTPNWTDYWTIPLYKDPTPCTTCQALARAVMMDQTSHDTAPPKREWVGLTDEDVHNAFNFTEMVKQLDFDRNRQEWCENFAAHLEAKLKEKNT